MQTYAEMVTKGDCIHFGNNETAQDETIVFSLDY